jgi:hypothetical protein
MTVETSDPTVLHVTAGDRGGVIAVVREEIARLPAEGCRPASLGAQPVNPTLDVDLMLYLCATVRDRFTVAHAVRRQLAAFDVRNTVAAH